MDKAEDAPKTAAETLESVLTFVKRSFMFWKRSTLVFLLVAGLAYPMVFLKARIYRSEVVVLYQENIRAESITGGDTGDNARRVGARLRETLLSRASLEPIVNQIPRYAALADRRGIVDAVDELQSHIQFKAREGDAFAISYESPDPAEAQDITQRLGQRLIDDAAKQRLEASKATRDFLENQSKQNKQKLDEANAQMAAFLDKHPEYVRLTLPGGPGAPTPTVLIPNAPPGTKDPTLYGYEAEKASIEKQLRGGKAGPVEAPPRGDSEETAAARRELANLRQQGYTEQHPDVAAAKRKLQTAIDNDAKRAPAPAPTRAPGTLTDAERDQLENRLKELRGLIAARRKGGTAAATQPAPSSSSAPAPIPSSANVTLDVEFRRLQRDVESLKDAQRQLDDKLFKADLTEGASGNRNNVQVKILDPAYLPVHPVSKPRSTMLAMYLAAAGVLAALLALISARLDDRIYARSELAMLDILPVVGVIPRARRR